MRDEKNQRDEDVEMPLQEIGDIVHRNQATIKQLEHENSFMVQSMQSM